jgi:shikimate dehydrogenase
MMTDQYGIIGFPLTHSFSQDYFNKKFAAEGIDAVYSPFAISSIEELSALLTSHPGIKGLSVTIPYKETIIPCLDELDPAAKIIGAVNCIDFKNGLKKGYNTDIIGFEQSLVPLLQPQHTKALILGTGGSSKAVAWVLKKLGIPFINVSRSKQTGQISYEELTPEMIAEHKLIINTTPLGQYPVTAAAAPIPYTGITEQHLLFDLVYNPAETKFLLQGKARGAATKNGYEMLVLQAEAAWKIWYGIR